MPAANRRFNFFEFASLVGATATHQKINLNNLRDSKAMNKALFIDRDGVINVDKRHVYRKEDFEFTAGIFDLCRKYSDAGYKLLIITNQAGIAKGIYTEDDFNSLMEWVVEEFNRRKITIDKVYYCSHHPDFTGLCRCRKPEAGMLLRV